MQKIFLNFFYIIKFIIFLLLLGLKPQLGSFSLFQNDREIHSYFFEYLHGSIVLYVNLWFIWNLFRSTVETVKLLLFCRIKIPPFCNFYWTGRKYWSWRVTNITKRQQDIRPFPREVVRPPTKPNLNLIKPLYQTSNLQAYRRQRIMLNKHYHKM